MNKGRLKILISEIILFVLIIVVEVSVFMCTTSVSFSSEPISVLENQNFTVNGYHVSSVTYTPTSYDPGIIFNNIGKNARTVCINFVNRVYANPDYELYFSSDENFTAENVIIGTIPFGARRLLLTLPAGEFDNIRLDINGKFSLSDVLVSEGNAKTTTQITRPLSVLRILVSFAFITSIFFIFLNWLRSPKSRRRLSGYELAFCIACFGFYFLWAISQGYNYAPDEAMRYDVTLFMFENNHIPVGSELLSDWGFSYAHLPAILCNQLGYVFMKIASLFTLDGRLLLLAARMVNVVCSTGAVYYAIKISKLLLKTPARWIMIVAFAFMPQFAFLSSYVNNDSVALLGICMIAYAWLLGIKYNWSYKNCFLLCIGMATCALSYYNSYAWILLSIFMFITSYLYINKKDYKELIKHIVFIVLIMFLLIGYNFLRHLVLYGDLLGFETSHYYGELFAIDSLKPDFRQSIFEQGKSFVSMFTELNWHNITWKSFMGVFGYMNVYCPRIIYLAISLFMLVGVIGLIVKLISFIKKRQKPDTLKLMFYLSTLLCGVITVALSMYNSYFTDFQPQGRYCYPAYLSLMLFITLGYDKLLQMFKKAEHKYAAVATVCTTCIGLSLYVFYFVYLPS